ncbi:MAG: phenylalanine--tRNA ligase subunit beta [Candidatus Marinimicrobia bacterium]|jgi:phenylalanyl-tRNA synthetase beta chain|nr:phenylalanine--tRNA ligase subunit beta [Candidatus Neomarinimicrobiota bacterium]MBT3496000.1 phenylalanine--tRNA ligase subunit beta [Candidatus Neomarinimicrobiota bacterium]MBT3692546.1 phenylalanine--tRNA ligase subunit beta [Candidatus Neomarinimicrobiota bacterium]MBT3732473.1 phenylalanine--tRNA ligase subunit beta [Candidatus Neomarinimicrobiota bacterium]MBT4144956.1 phenylalanine--tRNA ligase subunit beta [Candidatus Neomarinimicrobiota bacterium]
MIVSQHWLKDYVDIDATVSDLADMLSLLGLEAEVHTEIQPMSHVVIGKVKSAEKHPNADKLKLCQVFDGKKTHQVVCGAPNIDAGQTIVFAKEGAVLPGNFKLKKVTIRGVESNGMICSERELNLSDEHEGILVLDDTFQAGDSFSDVIGPIRASIELDITPNRPDAFSHIGVARDIAVKTNKVLALPKVLSIESDGEKTIPITMESNDDCPRYIGGIMEGITVSPSPQWLVDRLHAAGQRSINNLVDISNFVLLELGHPTHIFDYDKLKNKEILIRRSKKNESIVTLDEEKRELSEGQLLITDGKIPIAIAGIMGGLESAVSEKTTSVLIESAYFNAVVIRKGAKSLSMQTESSKRFERGVDPNGADFTFWRVVNLIQDLTGGKLVSPIMDIYPKVIKGKKITLRKSELSLIAGCKIDNKFVENTLSNLGFKVQSSENEWNCTAPTFRPDIEREIDIIEEIIRVYGYDNIPSDNNIYGSYRIGNPDPETYLKQFRKLMIGFGYRQVYNNSLQNETISQMSGKTSIPMMNPLSTEMAFLRTSLLPGLIQNADFNQKNGTTDIRLFELGNVHAKHGDSLGELEESLILSCITTGNYISDSVHEKALNQSVFTLKGILSQIIESHLGFRLVLKKSQTPGFDVSWEININGKLVGYMGQISSSWLKNLDTDIESAFAFEFSFEAWKNMLKGKQTFKPIQTFPKVSRHLNFVMEESIRVGNVLDGIKKKAGKLLTNAEPVDIFRDSELGKDMKSVTFFIEFQSPSKTLEDKDVNPIIDEIIGFVSQQYDAKLRV